MQNMYRLVIRPTWLLMVWALCLSFSSGVLAQAPLWLLQPDYDCATGAITFKTTGGNGSPITYTAPGITRSSLTSNTGVVEQGLRNDPKPITITATQNGETVSTTFDFALYCNTRQRSPLSTAIDNRTFAVGQLVLSYPDFVVGQGYYNSSDPYNYRNWQIYATGLPAGLYLGTSVVSGTLFVVGIGGSPTTPGVYPVRVMAIDPKFPNDPPYSTTFTITVTDPSVVNPPIKPPVLAKSIPDMAFTVGQVLKQEDFYLGNYIVDPTQSQPRYFPEWTASIKGLPAGIRQNSFGDLRYNLSVSLTGAPTVSGVYTVTATAATQYFASQPVTTTFNITVTDKPVNPPSVSMLKTLTVEYNCSTGVIGFYPYGSDDKPITTPVTYTAPGITRSSPTSNTGVVEQGLRNDPKPIIIEATQNGYTLSKTFDLKATCTLPNVLPPVARQIPDVALIVGEKEEQYNISQYFRDPNPHRSINFYLISFEATGTPPGLFFNDATDSGTGISNAYFTGTPTKPGTYLVTVTAYLFRSLGTGLSASSTFKIIVADSTTTPPSGSTLALLAPTYDCGTGAIHFNTSGGNGAAVEFQAPGITAWTANPDQVVDKDSRTANDVKPFTLMARQSGYMTTYTWDLKAACGRARVGAQEPNSTLSLTVLGNPVQEQLRVRIEGAEGQSVNVQLMDQTGRLLESRAIEQAGRSEERTFRLNQQNGGLLLLRAATSTQTSTVKIIKQ